MIPNIDHLKQWIGKVDLSTDFVSATPIRAMAATLDREDPAPKKGDSVPPCWHWLYFLPTSRQSDIGPDGHPKRGGFLPPVPLPRRMWAGSQIDFLRSIQIGSAIQRESRIVDVSARDGRTGPLIFVRVRHEISDEKGVAVVDTHDIVYRDNPQPGQLEPKAQMAASTKDWDRTILPDDVLLFRYSALTFNGHRIHYDRKYVTEVEGYKGLIVHGPLIATLLLDLLRRNIPTAQVLRFTFRALKPAFDTDPLKVCGRLNEDGKSAVLWAQNAEGALLMDATAVLN